MTFERAGLKFVCVCGTHLHWAHFECCGTFEAGPCRARLRPPLAVFASQRFASTPGTCARTPLGSHSSADREGNPRLIKSPRIRSATIQCQRSHLSTHWQIYSSVQFYEFIIARRHYKGRRGTRMRIKTSETGAFGLKLRALLSQPGVSDCGKLLRKDTFFSGGGGGQTTHAEDYVKINGLAKSGAAALIA